MRDQRPGTGSQPRRPAVAALVTAVVLGAAVVLGGCGDDEPAVSETLPTASATAPGSSSPDLPPLGPEDLPMPDEARTKDAAGAEAFLRYYMEIYNHAQATMDSTHMRDLSAGCETCDRIADDLDADRSDGYVYRGGEIRVDSLSEPYIQGDEAQLAFAVSQKALIVVEDGKPVEGLSFPPNASTTDGAILTWEQTRATWVLAQWDAA